MQTAELVKVTNFLPETRIFSSYKTIFSHLDSLCQVQILIFQSKKNYNSHLIKYQFDNYFFQNTDRRSRTDSLLPLV